MNRLMVIPAAGLGSRLSRAIPKVLFPVNGLAMIDHLLNLYGAIIDRFILVLHPSFQEQVVQHGFSQPCQIDYAIQEAPAGMLDAILIPKERVRHYQPTSVWITWCDQIAVQPKTISTLVTLSEQDSKTALIFPTVLRTEPYIHIARDDKGTIVDVLHRREGDVLPKVGESDMGLFSLSRKTYIELLPEFATNAKRGAVTQERNFLSFIPWLCQRGKVQTFPACDEIESVGINTPVDLARVAKYLHHG